jgi:methionyl-tRNA formyltransferase
MNVLVLGVRPSPIVPILKEYGCFAMEWENPVDVELLKEMTTDFAVSYRYRYKIQKEVIKYLKGKVINLHIALLPWNRGADPNLWSFLEDTPKGLTIHYVDEGIDTGDIIVQKEIFFEDPRDTLSTSYERLNTEIIQLFRQQWPLIQRGEVRRMKQPPGGSFHLTKDKKRFNHLLVKRGWDTPVRELRGMAIR